MGSNPIFPTCRWARHKNGTARKHGIVAEWLRRLPAKQLGFARAGSNPAVVENLTLFFIRPQAYLEILTG